MKKLALTVLLTALPAIAVAQAPAATNAPAPAAAKGDPVAGKGKAVAICSGCHGVPGTKAAYPEVYFVPKLGGQNADYIAQALRSYRGGERYNQTMKGLATALTDKEIIDIAAYYGQK